MLPDIALSDVKYKHGQKLPQERQKIATVIRTWGRGWWWWWWFVECHQLVIYSLSDYKILTYA